MQYIRVYRGLPGSGKSTRARKFISDQPDPSQWVRLNKDEMRSMLHDNVFSKERESLTHEMFMKLVGMALSAGKNVVVDNTHLTNNSIRYYHNLAEKLGDITVVEEWVRTPYSVCLERNAARTGHDRVPDSVMKEMGLKISQPSDSQYKSREDYTTVYQKNDSECFLKLEQNASLPHAIICDLDGTLALLNGRNPYDASTCENDELCSAVEADVHGQLALDRRIVFLSGRSDEYREQTLKFLNNHFGKWSDKWELHMRSKGDYRKDSIIKCELFDDNVRDKYYIHYVIDDRDSVVQLWRSMGLVCMQCRPGSF